MLITMAMLKSDHRIALEASAQTLEAALSNLDAKATLARAADIYKGELCAVSSFGAESAVILHIISEVARDTPILFLDTHKLFEETLAYRDALAERLSLTNVRTLTPEPDPLQTQDPTDDMYLHNSDMCCHIRKTLPLIKALRPFKLWISGRKRHHGGERAALPRVEVQDGKLKLNPLFDWLPERIDAYYNEHDLPRHPLVAHGYPSIGCLPCTAPVEDGNAPRAGRWVGQEKTECGIHFMPNYIVQKR